MLAQCVLVLFAMCAMLGLIIDVGYARMTQAQMQNAADAAAIEGVRNRNSVVDAAGLQNAFASDCLRRSEASQLVRDVFDDDINSANGDADYQFGAGPIIDLTDGVTNLHALATISAPDAHSYKPDLQLNQQNAVHGDMLSGSFSYSADPAPSEDSSFARNDFTPSATAPQGLGGLSVCPPSDQPPPDPGSGSLAADDAFLVRLRRSNELQGFPGQTEPDVASSGPSLPLLFGRATTIFGDDPSSLYSVRRDGLTVRATGIAQTRPALHVGLPQSNQPGVTSFALADTFVQTLNAIGCPATINPATGLITRAAGGPPTCVTPPGTVVGRFVANPAAVSTVGQLLPLPVPVACASSSGYGPVFALMATGTTRIIGFTRIGVSLIGAPTPGACPVVLFRGVSIVARSNATAVLTGGLPLAAGSAPSEVTELLDRNCPAAIAATVPSCALRRARAVNGVEYAPVLVPVLAR